METIKPPQFTGDEKPQGFLVVGIGASAGGVQALKEFFENLPPRSGMAYVVILHLSPDHDSRLAEVLQAVSETPVQQVLEKTQILPDHIYVVPPNQHLVLNDGFIAPTPNMEVEDRRAPVDIFFRNLAETHGPRAVSVVLSGTGANGSMGLKRIKEKGGVAYVQNPREAEFNEMPRHAIATDLVDEVLPVAEIPARIIAYRNSIGSVQIEVEPDLRPEQQQQALREIFTQLRIRTGHDFTNYKRPTLLRRIERRINLRSLSDLPSYAAFLHEHPDETHALLKDLLISVTNFFRDGKAFDVLERDVLPIIFGGKGPGDQVRIWVAGCATGEEAYSVAMLCAEWVMGAVDAPSVQIFATDIDDAAIAVAREGFYTLNDAADVSPDRLRRFFTKDGDGYRIRREVREMILFATHNFLKDPPFSRVDLVTCRNVLIYLNGVAQERVVETFHFALRHQGFLFLGTSETVDGATDLYSLFNRESHIYQAREITARNYPIPDSVPNFQFAKNDPLQKGEDKEGSRQRISFGELHQRLLEQYGPPSVVINEEYEIVHMTDKVGKYLEFTGGEPSQNLLKLVKPELRLELRSALYQAVQSRTAVEARNLRVMLNGEAQGLTLQIRPVFTQGDAAKGFILVLFQPSEEAIEDKEPVVMSADEPVAKKLEEELNLLKTQVRNSAEQHEFQAEELKASNEELQAMNEELRSAAEELETSKEELQSINEELRTVNQELKVKIDETTLVGNNLQNLINSTDVGTVFLDRNFSVRLFTPAILSIFNLKSSDYGRPVTDITNKLQYADLLPDAEKVLEKLQPVEKEVKTTDNRAYLMRLLPYRTAEDRINGVVITFLNITERIKAEEANRANEQKYTKLFSSIDEAFVLCEMILDEKGKPVDYRMLELNPAFEKMTGITVEAAKGKTAKEVVPALEEWWIETYGKVVLEQEPVRFENYVAALDRWFNFYASPFGEVGSKQFVIVYSDITRRKKEEEGQAYLIKLTDAFRSLQSPVQIQEAVTGFAMEYFNADRCYYYEVIDDNAVILRDAFRGDLPSVAGSYHLDDYPVFKSVIEGGLPLVVTDVHISDKVDEALRNLCIQMQVISFIHIPVIKSGNVRGVLCLVNGAFREWKQTEVLLATETAERTWAAVERARAEEALHESEERLRLATVAADIFSWEYNVATDTYSFSENAAGILGIARLPQTPEDGWQLSHPNDQELIQKTLEDAIANAKGFAVDFRSVKDDGSIVWLSVQTTMMTDAAGKPSRLLGIAQDVTLRKQIEEAVRKSENRLQRLVNIPRIGVLTFDYSGNLLNANDAFLQLVGYTREEFAQRQFTWKDFTPAEYVEESVEIIKQLRTTGRGGPYEKEYFRKDGSRIWLMFVAADLGDGTIGEYAVDISDRKKAEDLLRQFNEQLEGQVKERTEDLQKNLTLLQQAEDLAGMGSWEYDLAAGRFTWSSGMYKLFGLAEGDPVAPEIYIRFAVEEDRLVAERLAKAIRRGTESFDETLCLNVAGTIRVVKIKGATVKDAGGNLSKVMGVDLDITAVRESEQKMAEQAHFIQSTNQALPDILFVMDLHTKVFTYINHSFEEKMGYTEAQREKINVPLFDIMHEEDRPGMMEHVEKMKTALDGEIREIEYRLVAPDDSLRWFSDRDVVFRRDKAGIPVEKIGIAQEITARKKAEQELKETNTSLRYANENLQQFASIASHDLQEPLRKLKLFVSALGHYNASLPQEGKELLSKISLTSERMSQLIREVLQYSKIAYGAKEFVPTDLDAVLKNVLDDLDLLLQETEGVIEYKGRLSEIDAIPPQMNQLFYNLLTNALKFRRSGVKPVIKISCSPISSFKRTRHPELKEDKNHIEIIFSDNGIGFEQEYAEQIFQIFERLYSADEFEGTGVGLALCKKIVENHSGHIYAVSSEGEGASFYVILPVKQ